MEEEIITSVVLEREFADDTELQIMQLLQTNEGREVLLKAIDHIRTDRRKPDESNTSNTTTI